MNEDQHARLSELYLQASDLKPEERDAFHAKTEAEHPSLAEELRRMLQEDVDLPGILQTGSMARSLESLDTELPQSIGPYRVVELLGEGGMGIVYRAMQEAPIRREVAVKLIKLGIETEPVVKRFESERQTLALMNHPNIARVIDAGTTEHGRSYFAMEYVGGVPITQYCDDQRLTIRERLELFMTVCKGVQHAHHNGIIHRDIKPSNILVTTQDGKPVPKIIDFGVSKALDRDRTKRTMLTQIGQFVGTPEYMSPEQTEPDSRNVDTRTDVYALGVLLYELSTGALPFDPEQLRDSDLSEIKRLIREEDPRTPSDRVRSGEAAMGLARKRRTDPANLSKRLRRDIDWIVMKALEKDRERRYGSPAELAADVDLHLNHEPVLAGPPSAAYRTRKFLRKRRIAVAFASVLSIGATVFAVAMAVQSNQFARERDRATREAETAEALSKYFEGLFDVSSVTDRRHPSLNPLEIVDQGIELIPTLEGQPLFHATFMRLFGALQSGLGRPQKAIPMLEEASRQLESLLGSEDPATLTARHELAVAYGRTYRREEALALFESVVAARERVLGVDHPGTVSTQFERGLVFKMLKRYDEAGSSFASAFEGMRRVRGPRDPMTLVCASFLASIYLDQLRHDEAEALLSSLVGPMRDVLGEHHIEYRAVQYNLAAVTLAAGNKDRALVLLDKLWGGPPTDPGVDPHFKDVWNDPRLDPISNRRRLADGVERAAQEEAMERLVEDNRFDEAEKLATELYHASRAYLGPDHQGAEDAALNLAWILNWQERPDEARLLLEEILDRRRSRFGVGTFEESEILQLLAHSEVAAGGIVEATALMDRARSIRLRDGGPNNGGYLILEAEYQALTGDLDGALETVRRRGFGRSTEDSVRYSPAFRRYANDPRFKAFLAEFGDHP